MINDTRAHALLGASSAHRWLECTPSVKLEEQFPDSSSTFAEEGSLAHELAELKLRKEFLEQMSTKAYNAAIKKLKAHELWQDEMLNHTETYVDYIKSVAFSMDASPYIAAEKRVDYSAYAPEGFGTADCIMISGKNLHVIDFKYGKGVPVSAEDNPQMKLYALGAILEYGILYPIETVNVAVVQPRLGSISEWSISHRDLIHWANEVVVPKAELAHKGEGEYSPGDHCKFCRARSVCRARAEKNIALAEFTALKPPIISNEEVGEFLKKGKDLTKWISDLQDYALSESLRGSDVPGWKAVEGRGSREWTDMDEAFKVLVDSGIDEEILWERRPVTLPVIEKCLGKSQFNEMLKEYVVSRPGKPALAPAEDKRKAIGNVISASDAFANKEQED